MVNSESNEQQSDVRVHWLFVPSLKYPIGWMVLLCVGVLLTCAVAVTSLVLVAVSLGPNIKPPFWLFPFTIGLMAGLPFLWVPKFSRAIARRRLRASMARSARLAHITETEKYAARLPHRVIENVLRLYPEPKRRTRRALRSVSTGRMIVVYDPNMPHRWRPDAKELMFEPLDLSHDSDRGLSLLRLSADVSDEDTKDPGHPPGETESMIAMAGRLTRLRYRRLWVLYTIAVIYLIVRLATSANCIIAAAVTLALGCSIFPRLLLRRQWWLVPGGLILREDKAWRRGVDVHLFNTDSSALFIDMRNGQGMVYDGCKVWRFQCAPFNRWLVVAGWTSTAQRPTLDEVRSFLGVDQESNPGTQP